MKPIAQRTRTPWVTILVIGALVASGCTGVGKGADADTPAPTGSDAPLNEPNATPSDDAGALVGVVLDEEELPLDGARVSLKDVSETAIETDATGQFGFSDLEPGPYVVVVQALGYHSAARTTTVSAGELTRLHIVLRAEAIQGVPYSKTLDVQTSKFFCGFNALVVTSPCKGVGFTDPEHPVEQGWGTVAGNESNVFVWETVLDDMKANADDELANVVAEIVWDPVSASAQQLIGRIEQNPASGTGRNATPVIWTQQTGSSPLRVVVAPGKTGEGGQAAMHPNVTGFTVSVSPAADDRSGTVVPLPTVFVEQRFDVWVTLFYNQAAPEDFTHVR